MWYRSVLTLATGLVIVSSLISANPVTLTTQDKSNDDDSERGRNHSDTSTVQSSLSNRHSGSSSNIITTTSSSISTAETSDGRTNDDLLSLHDLLWHTGDYPTPEIEASPYTVGADDAYSSTSIMENTIGPEGSSTGILYFDFEGTRPESMQGESTTEAGGSDTISDSPDDGDATEQITLSKLDTTRMDASEESQPMATQSTVDSEETKNSEATGTMSESFQSTASSTSSQRSTGSVVSSSQGPSSASITPSSSPNLRDQSTVLTSETTETASAKPVSEWNIQENSSAGASLAFTSITKLPEIRNYSTSDSITSELTSANSTSLLADPSGQNTYGATQKSMTNSSFNISGSDITADTVQSKEPVTAPTNVLKNSTNQTSSTAFPPYSAPPTNENKTTALPTNSSEENIVTKSATSTYQPLTSVDSTTELLPPDLGNVTLETVVSPTKMSEVANSTTPPFTSGPLRNVTGIDEMITSTATTSYASQIITTDKITSWTTEGQTNQLVNVTLARTSTDAPLNITKAVTSAEVIPNVTRDMPINSTTHFATTVATIIANETSEIALSSNATTTTTTTTAAAATAAATAATTSVTTRTPMSEGSVNLTTLGMSGNETTTTEEHIHSTQNTHSPPTATATTTDSPSISTATTSTTDSPLTTTTTKTTTTRPIDLTTGWTTAATWTFYTSGYTTGMTTMPIFTESEIRRISADRKMSRLFYISTPGRSRDDLRARPLFETCTSLPNQLMPNSPDIPTVVINPNDFSKSYACGLCLSIGVPWGFGIHGAVVSSRCGAYRRDSDPSAKFAFKRKLVLNKSYYNNVVALVGVFPQVSFYAGRMLPRKETVRVAGMLDFFEKGDLLMSTRGPLGSTTENVTFEAVACPVQGSNVVYSFTKSRRNMLQMQVHNSRYPVTRMQIRQNENVEWEKMIHSTEATFIYMGAKLNLPFFVRIYSYNGFFLVDRFDIMLNDIPYQSGHQFPVAPDHAQFVQESADETNEPGTVKPGETSPIINPDTQQFIGIGKDGSDEEGEEWEDENDNGGIFLNPLLPDRVDHLRNGSGLPNSWLRGGRPGLSLLFGDQSTTEGTVSKSNLTNYDAVGATNTTNSTLFTFSRSREQRADSVFTVVVQLLLCLCLWLS
ncbi:hypothetical protein PoB_002010000 [Plakobranchus ocellatus]|uniref:Uncharacterized protein n=1 Tax=Plakobranchus ocellatus TaxID=259542 RepID=A0AAV3ZGC6_9GAST|nr:hypothetical protein PoB_002010000 [Plakobranchus ocellatus]